MESLLTEVLTTENYDAKVLRFQDRQAGVSLIFDPDKDLFTYNAYCLELKSLKELFSIEFDELTDALDLVNSEFSEWTLADVYSKKSCACKSKSQKTGCCGRKCS